MLGVPVHSAPAESRASVKWVPVERHDGSRGWVNVETAEVTSSMLYAIGMWDHDAGLGGLLASMEAEADGGAGPTPTPTTTA